MYEEQVCLLCGWLRPSADTLHACFVHQSMSVVGAGDVCRVYRLCSGGYARRHTPAPLHVLGHLEITGVTGLDTCASGGHLQGLRGESGAAGRQINGEVTYHRKRSRSDHPWRRAQYARELYPPSAHTRWVGWRRKVPPGRSCVH